VNVYPDPHPPLGTPATSPLREPLTEDVDPRSSSEAYGRMKVALAKSHRPEICLLAGGWALEKTRRSLLAHMAQTSSTPQEAQ